MKKQLFLILFLIPISGGILAQMPHLAHSLAQYGLKGKVQSITERTGECVIKFGEYQFANNEHSFNIFTFNSGGKLTTHKEYYTDGSLKTYEKFSYKSNLIISTRYNSDGTEANSIEYIYPPKSSSHTQYTYYNNGMVKTEMHMSDFGVIFEKRTYNSNGQMIERKKYKEPEVADDVFSYQFDSNGNLQSMSRTRTGGLIAGILTYQYLKYDSWGNWIIRVEFQQNSEFGEKKLTRLTTRMIEYY